MCDDRYFIKRKLCPVCQKEVDSINYIENNNSNLLRIDCPKCNPEEFGEFQISTIILPNINELSQQQRIWMSENIRDNAKNEKDKVLIHSNNIDFYMKRNFKDIRI
ncbi:MAG: hypothetical protein PF574_07670 [Candidatus Delongbacteria bacterium]|jgi:hypothetical protein|nr:hypothetical protein [Candidatus Delongbacteria bacterium]